MITLSVCKQQQVRYMHSGVKNVAETTSSWTPKKADKRGELRNRAVFPIFVGYALVLLLFAQAILVTTMRMTQLFSGEFYNIVLEFCIQNVFRCLTKTISISLLRSVGNTVSKWKFYLTFPLLLCLPRSPSPSPSQVFRYRLASSSFHSVFLFAIYSIFYSNFIWLTGKKI